MALPTNWENNIGMQVDAAFLNELCTEVNSKPDGGTLALRPTASSDNTGQFYFCTDNNVLYRSNGTAWQKYRIGGDSCDAMGDVPTTGWTAVNMQTGASFAADKDAMLFTVPNTGSGDNWQYQYRAYPTPPFTLTAHLDLSWSGTGLLRTDAAAKAFAGIVVSDGTKLLTHGLMWYNTSPSAPFTEAGLHAGTAKWTNGSTFSGGYNSYFASQARMGSVPRWFRLSDDGTNLAWQYSANGSDWATTVTEARGAYLTPSRIGVGGSNYLGIPLRMRVRSWSGVA